MTGDKDEWDADIIRQNKGWAASGASHNAIGRESDI